MIKNQVLLTLIFVIANVRMKRIFVRKCSVALRRRLDITYERKVFLALSTSKYLTMLLKKKYFPSQCTFAHAYLGGLKKGSLKHR